MAEEKSIDFTTSRINAKKAISTMNLDYLLSMRGNHLEPLYFQLGEDKSSVIVESSVPVLVCEEGFIPMDKRNLFSRRRKEVFSVSGGVFKSGEMACSNGMMYDPTTNGNYVANENLVNEFFDNVLSVSMQRPVEKIHFLVHDLKSDRIYSAEHKKQTLYDFIEKGISSETEKMVIDSVERLCDMFDKRGEVYVPRFENEFNAQGEERVDLGDILISKNPKERGLSLTLTDHPKIYKKGETFFDNDFYRFLFVTTMQSILSGNVSETRKIVNRVNLALQRTRV